MEGTFKIRVVPQIGMTGDEFSTVTSVIMDEFGNLHVHGVMGELAVNKERAAWRRVV